MLSERGLTVVGVGNVRECAEWFDDLPPKVNIAWWHGELSVRALMGLVSQASVIVAGPGWTVPAAAAYRVPHVVVYGGAAKWNRLDKLLAPRMGELPLTAVEPDNFCRACKTVRTEE